MSDTNEWLPMPSGISLTPHESFTKDLLRQFDKKRSQFLSNNEEDDVTSEEQMVQEHDNENRHSLDIATGSNIITEEDDQQRRRSAGDLLRKSSLYLRNKFNTTEEPRALRFHSWTLKSKKTKRDAQEIFRNDSAIQPQLSKVVINTTIRIDQQPSVYTTPIIQPPIITQYPPKPLKYSPVEPLPGINQQDDDDASMTHHKRYKTLHRLSLPLLRLTAQQQPTIQRTRSDSDLLNQEKPSIFQSIGKQWQKLLYTCRKKKR